MTTELRAGPVSMLFDGGALRHLAVSGREVLRALYVAIRDRHWNTIPNRISGLDIRTEGGGFEVSFEAECVAPPIDFVWKASIRGDAVGTVEFRMDGRARSTFLRNRIGLCALHPIREFAGTPVVVTHVDGTRTEGRFPRLVSPHQPFKRIRSILHDAAELTLEGDVFEMEDQRNWTDGSFKTYSTPLEIPFPVEVREGTTISQSATLTCKDRAPHPSDTASVRVDRSKELPFPAIGFGVRTIPRNLDRLRALRPAHLRVDVRPEDSLDRAAEVAKAVGATLEVAALVATEGDLKRLAGQLPPEASTVLVFPDPVKCLTEEWARAARAALPGIRLGGGTNNYLAELNRGQVPAALLDLVTFSMNPQVHLPDELTWLESLEGQSDAIETARAIAGKTPVAVSPLTLRPRFNPNATGPDPEPPADPRQRSAFAAAWTVASLRRLVEGGASSLTCFEVDGPRGLSDGDDLFPLYRVFADLAGAEAAFAVRSSDPLRVDGLAFRRQKETVLLLANLRPDPERVDLDGRPIDLAPYQILKVTI